MRNLLTLKSEHQTDIMRLVVALASVMGLASAAVPSPTTFSTVTLPDTGPGYTAVVPTTYPPHGIGLATSNIIATSDISSLFGVPTASSSHPKVAAIEKRKSIYGPPYNKDEQDRQNFCMKYYPECACQMQTAVDRFNNLGCQKNSQLWFPKKGCQDSPSMGDFCKNGEQFGPPAHPEKSKEPEKVTKTVTVTPAPEETPQRAKDTEPANTED